MMRLAFPMALALSLSLISPASLSSQEQGCKFNIAGTWQSSTGAQVNPARERFGSDGMLTELSRNGTEWQAVGKSRYKLDNEKSPKRIIVTKVEKGDQALATNLEVKALDDGMFVTGTEGESEGELTRWIRVDPYRYFVVLAAGKGSPGFGAPGFAMLIKTDGLHPQTESFGTWPVVNPLERHPLIGSIPEEIRRQFDREPLDDSGSMLRLEVTAGPYNRALEVMKSWQRRAEENQLLYPNIPYLNNAVYLNQLTSSLNEAGVLTWRGGKLCSETIKLQKLTWLLDDAIMSKHNLPQTPYFLFKTLRQLNGSLHLSDSQFQAAVAGGPSAAIAMSAR